jgi:hypothetical protein
MDERKDAQMLAWNPDRRSGGGRNHASQAGFARRAGAVIAGSSCARWWAVVLVLAVAGSAGCRSSTGLAAGGAGVSSTSPQTLATAVSVLNREGEVARNVRVTKLSLAGGALTDKLPIDLGTIAPGEAVPLYASFAGKFAPEGSYALNVEGIYDENNGSKPFKFDLVLVVPKRGPGQGALRKVEVASDKVSGAPFPPQPPKFDEEEVNQTNWTVPIGPPVNGVPTQTPTGIQRGSGKASASTPQNAGPIVINANSPLGLSGAGPGPVSTVAEPSGATNGGSVIFATTNWTAAYSSDGGASFHQVNPTAIFPADVIGYCCDQVVQYAPSIDRFIWFLQGNGYRLAVARPADLVASGATAWTYWNLDPTVFGQPAGTGFDYPDLSIGDNYLYMSWDVGFPACPGCRSGFQVTRTSLAGLAAGGTITLEFTDPPDAPMAWGSHLTQDTGNEIFWAGHNTTSNMRVFSLAEGSGFYFWSDVSISSWPSGALSSITPDGVNWVAGSGGFPGNDIIGSTRVGNQLWFAWTAAGNGQFRQPHVEIAVLDRAAGYSVLQRVQIWNNAYGFAYPALATNACTHEVGLSLEYGGPSDFENHVVGLWGDFVVYVMTGSNVGTPRFGDYVTIRQQPRTPADRGNLFNAFGYGLKAGAATPTDAHYVLFGRPGDQCR